ncbi:hypothetical protein GIB67_026268 [Kingdonia uniflora]|uniref:Uncharacterized protein n=1 Tax=Kingdonia uniflora TaxID=39325 RepID=A0A7J7L9U7_9MAGN|nr:hypothetical protein GIB67_026268 [Kingdonia uniflora]
MNSFLVIARNGDTVKSQCSQSFSSLAFSSSSNIYDASPLSSSQSVRIPFSWEQEPGIPKRSPHQRSKTKCFMPIALPLPPAQRKLNIDGRVTRDPFLLALVECSKDQASETKVSSRTLCYRGFVDFYACRCKNTRDVAESKLTIPRSKKSRGTCRHS